MGDDLSIAVELILQDEKFKRELEAIVRRFRGAEDDLGGSAGRMGDAFAKMEKKVLSTVSRIEKRLIQFGSAAAAALATAFTGEAVSLASEFERSVANISTLLDEGSVSIERYRDQLLELSTRSSKDVLDLSQALYQTISAGIPAVEGAGGAFEFLDAAQRAAVAGLASTEEAVNALATVVNAFGRENISAGRASDLLFESIKKGRTTFPELASALGRVAPVAASFNASTEEMLGLLVELTKAGLSTDEAVTAVRSVFLGLVRPAKKVQKELDKLGLSFSAQEIKTKGVVGVFRELTEAVGGDADALAQLFPNVRALLPAVVSVGEGFGDFEATVKNLEGAVGATDRALEKIKPTFSETAAIFKSQLQAVLINAGQRVLPLLQKRIEALGNFLTENGDQIGDAFERFVEALDAVATFVKQNGETIIKWLLRVWAITKIVAFTKAVQGAAAAIASFGAIGAKLASVMTGAGVVGAALAGAALLGQYIGEKLGDVVVDTFVTSMEKLEDEAKRIAERAREELDKVGFESEKQRIEARQQVESGTAIPLGGVSVGELGTTTFSNDLVSAQELVKQQGEAAIATAESVGASLEQAANIYSKKADQYRAEFDQAQAELIAEEPVLIANIQKLEALRRELDEGANPRRIAQLEGEIARLVSLGSEARLASLRQEVSGLERALDDAESRASSLLAGVKRLIKSVNDEIEKAKRKKDREDEEEKKRLDRLARERAEKRRGELARLNDIERAGLGRRAALNRQAEEAEAARIQQRLAESKAALEEELAERKRVADGEREFADARLLSADDLEARLRRVGASADAVARVEAEGLLQQLEILDEVGAQAQKIADARKAEADAVAQASIEAEEAVAAELRRKQPQDRKRIAELSRKVIEDVEEDARQKKEKAEDDLNKKLAELGQQRLAIELAIANARERQSDAIRNQDDGLRETLQRLRELGDERGSDFLKELARDALDVADGASKEAAGVIASALIAALTTLPEAAEEAAKEAFGDRGEGTGEYVKGLVEELVENIDEALTALEEIDEKIFEATAQAAADFSEAVGSAFEGGADRFVSAVNTAARSINEAIVAPIRALLGDGIASELVGGLLEIPGQIASAIQSRFLSPFLSAVEGPLNELTRGFGEAASTLLSIEENRDDDRRRINEDFDARLAALREGGASPERVAALQQERERALSGVSSEQRSPAEIIDETFERALRILAVITEQLPTLVSNVVDRLIAELPRILAGVAQAITGVLNALVGRLGPLLSSVIETIAAELPALIESAFALLPDVVVGIFGGLVSILDRLPEIVDGFFEGLISSLPEIITGLVKLLPQLVVALIKLVPSIIGTLVSLIPRIIAELIEAMVDVAGAFGRQVREWVTAAGEAFIGWITSAARWVADIFFSVGDFFLDIINGIADFFSDIGGGIADFFGGIFHDGGVVGGRGGSSMGIFHDGGVVGSMRSNLNGLARDESVNILQDGEVVLNRAAVAALGGATNADRLNGRDAPFSLGSPTVEIHANDSATRALLEQLIGGLVVNLRTPGGSVLKTATRAANGKIQGVR